MNRYVSLLGILLVASMSCRAQRVHYSSQTIHQPHESPAIKAIRPNRYFSPAITLKYADGHKQAIPKDSIWGYEDRSGALYRYYKGSFYRVTTTKDLVHYIVRRPARRGVVNVSYFSQTYDTPIRWTRAKARRDSGQIVP